MLGTFALTSMSRMAAYKDDQGKTIIKKELPAAVKMHLRFLEANLAKSLLINEALWELIRDKLGLTEQDLHERLYQIDMRDGVLDGKNQRKVSECPACHRKVSPRHPACLYCGQVLDDTVFQMSQ